MTKQASLPESFWAQPEPALGDEALQLIYAEIIARLRAENPEADTLELMLIERVAFLYVHIRYKETKRLFENDRAYKETMATWAGLAADLRKERVRLETVEHVRQAILDAVHNAVIDSMKTIPADLRKDVEVKLTNRLDEIGL